MTPSFCLPFYFVLPVFLFCFVVVVVGVVVVVVFTPRLHFHCG